MKKSLIFPNLNGDRLTGTETLLQDTDHCQMEDCLREGTYG